jgi:hypothetical protein
MESEGGQCRDLATRIVSGLTTDGEIVSETTTIDAVVEEEPPLQERVRFLQWDSVVDSTEWT